MEQKAKAVEVFFDGLNKLPPHSPNPSVFEMLNYTTKLMALAEKVFEAGYNAGLTEKTINDLNK